MSKDGICRYKLRGATFERFVAFVFDRPVGEVVLDGDQEVGPWYWAADVDFDPTVVAGFYARLFRDPQAVVRPYSPAQLEQGFWAIQSRTLTCSVSTLVWNTAVPLDQRIDCVRAMFDLYDRLFSLVPLKTASSMWWDSLACDWHCGTRVRGIAGDDDVMQDVMFETLARILTLRTVECQAAALHGLAHLHHPGTAALIDRHLHVRSIDFDLRDHALAASRFEVM